MKGHCSLELAMEVQKEKNTRMTISFFFTIFFYVYLTFLLMLLGLKKKGIYSAKDHGLRCNQLKKLKISPALSYDTFCNVLYI